MRLVLLMLIGVMLAPLGHAEEQVKVTLQVEPEPRVGTPSELLISVTDASGKPLEAVISPEIQIAEEGVTLFSGSFYAPDGRLRLLYHFQDASEHAINLRVMLADGTVVERTFIQEVQLPEPPTKVWLKTWAFLMGVLLLGILAGFSAVALQFRKAG
ncbi:MAG: hypothetical protein GXN98_03805 [Euryarchaeota archaeon]|nr:hypothetical protein [Euryarchaeota archaeon]